MTLNDKVSELQRKLNELEQEHGLYSVLILYEKEKSYCVAFSTDEDKKEATTRLQSALTELKNRMVQESAINN